MPASSETQHLAENELAHRSVILPKHLHARPAGQIAQAAGRHRPTTIKLSTGDRHANAHSILAILALGAVTGTHIHITVQGPNATTIADDITNILTSPETAG
jgi:phosphotransferase system HPr (HPr) family protein